MDLTVLVMLALPIAFFLTCVGWTNVSNNVIAVEHRETVRQVRERVLRERLARQRQRERAEAEPSPSPSSIYEPAPRPSATSPTFQTPAEPAEPAEPAADSQPQPSVPAADASNEARDCPICLSPPSYCLETNCGHIYCTDCILEYYQRGNANFVQQAVVCPCCRRRVDALVTKFTPEEERAPAGREKLVAIRAYNKRHSGEPRSFQERIADTPHLLRRLFAEASRSPGSAMRLLFQSHFLLSFLATFLYVLSPFDLLPELAFGALGFVDDAIILVAFCVIAASIYRTLTLQRQ